MEEMEKYIDKKHDKSSLNKIYLDCMATIVDIINFLGKKGLMSEIMDELHPVTLKTMFNATTEFILMRDLVK